MLHYYMGMLYGVINIYGLSIFYVLCQSLVVCSYIGTYILIIMYKLNVYKCYYSKRQKLSMAKVSEFTYFVKLSSSNT